MQLSRNIYPEAPWACRWFGIPDATKTVVTIILPCFHHIFLQFDRNCARDQDEQNRA